MSLQTALWYKEFALKASSPQQARESALKGLNQLAETYSWVFKEGEPKAVTLLRKELQEIVNQNG